MCGPAVQRYATPDQFNCSKCLGICRRVSKLDGQFKNHILQQAWLHRCLSCRKALELSYFNFLRSDRLADLCRTN